MDGEEQIIKVRAALLFVLLQRLGTDRPDALVEIKNNQQVKLELQKLGDRHRMVAASSPAA